MWPLPLHLCWTHADGALEEFRFTSRRPAPVCVDVMRKGGGRQERTAAVQFLDTLDGLKRPPPPAGMTSQRRPLYGLDTCTIIYIYIYDSKMQLLQKDFRRSLQRILVLIMT